MRNNSRIIGVFLLAVIAMMGCSFAPALHVPSPPQPDEFKEAFHEDDHWQIASAQAGQADREKWWLVFNDLALNALQDEAAKNNPGLEAAAARLEQATAAVKQIRANLFPQIGISAGVNRGDITTPALMTNYSLLGTVSYAIDLFGRLHDATAAARFDRQEIEALYHQVMLLLHADVAQSYFNLLALDTERGLLKRTIALREESQALVERRFKEGEAGEQEALRAKAELASTQAELSALDQQRAIVEHMLAILLGRPPSQFTQPAYELPTVLPVIPAGVPSTVLERRPDIAAAQADLAAANARIGLAKAAFFPTISLTAQGGIISNDLEGISHWSNRAWAVGPLVSLPIFDGGRRSAVVMASNAVYRESVANYRERVLSAFKEVEDNLSSLRLLDQRADQLFQAAEAAKKAETISRIRYREGEAGFLEVLDTQRDTLTAERLYTQSQGQRFIATVNLVRALGGGWGGGGGSGQVAAASEPAGVEAPVKTKIETAPASAVSAQKQSIPLPLSLTPAETAALPEVKPKTKVPRNESNILFD